MSAACHMPPAAAPRFDASRVASGTIANHVPGCYELKDGVWQTDKRLAVFYAPQYLPRRFQFDTTTFQGWVPLQDAASPMWSLRARPLTESGYSSFTYWRRLRKTADTIYVGAPLPLGGASMTLWPVVDGMGRHPHDVHRRDSGGRHRVRHRTDSPAPIGVRRPLDRSAPGLLTSVAADKGVKEPHTFSLR